MSDNPLTLFCLVDGEATSSAFPVSASTTTTIGELKDIIRAKIPDTFNGVDAKDLTLWRVSIPDKDDDETPIKIDNVPENEKKKLRATNKVSIFGAALPEDTIHVIVQRPPSEATLKRRYEQDPQSVPLMKRIRLEEAWQSYTASDGSSVDLPPSFIDILASSEFVPEPRAAFAHLKGDLQPADSIAIPSMGQTPKEFGSQGLGQTLFVTEQMLELWEDMSGDKNKTYRRVLSGPMGVGKSYLSYYLTARAYAEGWLVLYISDAGLLDKGDENIAALQIVQRFLALNKDILTGTDIETLVNEYDGTRKISRNALSAIFHKFLKSRDRKTLLLVDEHGKLFEELPFMPVKFKSLDPLSNFNFWDEDYIGTHLIFTGTAHAKYEMTILPESYRPKSVVFVGPLSGIVFSKLLDTYSRLATPAVRDEVTAITNCVPRELVNLFAFLRLLPDPISMDNLQRWMEDRSNGFQRIAEMYYRRCDGIAKERFFNALLHTFLGSTTTATFDWDFVDLGLIYRSLDLVQGGVKHHILCRPAQSALLELFKTLPYPEVTKNRLLTGSLEGNDFETAIWHQLICISKPIVLNATDLNGNNPATITLDFSHCDTIQTGRVSLGSGYDKVLTRGYQGYPRFDFMLGPMFFQVSIKDFGKHNTGSADITKAFDEDNKDGMGQIARYLDDLYGPGHSAKIEDCRFVVTCHRCTCGHALGDVHCKCAPARVTGFHIVYIRGSPGKPTHRDLVKKFPDVLHVSYEELMETLFKNVV